MKIINKLILACMLTLLGLSASYSQDWADLNRFKEENSKIPSAIENEDRIVFMGNSITIGWLNNRPEFFEGKPYINRGISGQTTPQIINPTGI